MTTIERIEARHDKWDDADYVLTTAEFVAFKRLRLAVLAYKHFGIGWARIDEALSKLEN